MIQHHAVLEVHNSAMSEDRDVSKNRGGHFLLFANVKK